MNQEQKRMQAQIIAALGVQPVIDPVLEIIKRVGFLASALRAANKESYILGISGGVDSTTSGRLAVLACEQLRGLDYHAQFIAVRLPYGEQRDEADAQRALDFIKPHKVITVNIKPAVDAIMASMDLAGLTDKQIDFLKGNVKARQRMIVQYALAGQYNGLVIGTDHASEALMGFFTKHGDGAADIVPKATLEKEQVREVAAELGAPSELVGKPPTADLEDLNPGLLDEVAYGVTYATISKFLRGLDISENDAAIIIKQYYSTAHKRSLAPGI
jgi:NAD+ synthase